LFIDEIGELHPIQMNKLLKVLEDRKVFFESAYYSKENPQIPSHIHDIFQNGLPADFRLVGATTRTPNEIPPAIRSRCLEVFFRELDQDEIALIAKKATEKIRLNVSESGIRLLAAYARNGREAVNMMQIAAGLAITENRDKILDKDIEWVIHSSQMAPRYEKKIASAPAVGVVNGLAVYGPNTGALLEIEVTALPAKGKGTINVTGIIEEESIGSAEKSVRRKSMARGSAENVITVLRAMGVPADRYDIHVNFPGGAPVDGPSAGVAIAVGIYSAIYQLPVDHTIAMTGEISIRGYVKPVGGVFAKIKAAKQAGAKKVIIPLENMQSLLREASGIQIIAVRRLEEALMHVFGEEALRRGPAFLPAAADRTGKKLV
ncbi:S16 family serine protease, partial [Geobacillus sp. ZGt-1]|uniref:S16 family serine protease n=1 Tax=Geobacillus sp. ZGt-1 TaxID=1631556 RepID=UPI00064AFC56